MKNFKRRDGEECEGKTGGAVWSHTDDRKHDVHDVGLQSASVKVGEMPCKIQLTHKGWGELI